MVNKNGYFLQSMNGGSSIANSTINSAYYRKANGMNGPDQTFNQSVLMLMLLPNNIHLTVHTRVPIHRNNIKFLLFKNLNCQ
ncbi:hypothetical protein M3Y98_00563400 [Aphelenchoides besseyi]|nr:hypothetical protein M3Y98_00563400 [Aphelenchoides besseyi]